jgi:tRNA pseudouridine13 synthase
MTWPSGEVAALEARVAADRGVDARALAPGGGALRGARRPLRVPLTEPAVAGEGDDLIVSFGLPPGAYATVVLREVTKVED